MTTDRPFRKIFPTPTGAQQMYQLLGLGEDPPIEQRLSDDTCSAGWFEVTEDCYQFARMIWGPLFSRPGMFAVTKRGTIASIFFEITVRGRRRWFHGYCDLSDPQSPERMRAAIIAFETRAFDSMTRAEKLEAIWAWAPDDFKGIAGAVDPKAWPTEHLGKRTILVNGGALGTVLKLLEQLTDAEIEEKLAPQARWNASDDDAPA
ncbi:MAG: DUF1419 domain-containing protein [Bosea sp.]|uniref:DUF1419 domain-containing protein n=1 Tax=Hyphomicrobiales TaxID=356 RepID=UPI00083258B5|nr:MULTISPECIES: DUF1419 domain-containing protein [Hyphomicrobiales]MCP4561745.1 DUF1419 domain-containing protein [Bosea sp. (in: a-proteobacteria)]MCP4736936.1 DUF1419 domain-containing protein [Bosea sp. (in: a-proteobacteria)]MDX3805051.1 DUF1419 domain-containing protein [Bosea sp. (in: a-proteobacteria)]